MTTETSDSSPAKIESPIHWWWGIIAFAAAMGLQLVFGFVISLLAMSLGTEEVALDGLMELLFSPLFLGIQVVVTSGMLIALSLLLPRLLNKSSTKFLRLSSVSNLVVVLSVIGVIAGGFIVDQTLYFLHGTWPSFFELNNLEYFGRAFRSCSLPVFLVLMAIVSLGPGLGEELLFRGFILRSSHNDMPGWIAVCLSAVLFGVMHVDPLQGFGAGMIGFYFGFLALRSGSIWPAVWAHGINNMLASLFARFGGSSDETIWTEGHPLWILLIATLVTGAAVVGILKLTPSSASSEINQ